MVYFKIFKHAPAARASMNRSLATNLSDNLNRSLLDSRCLRDSHKDLYALAGDRRKSIANKFVAAVDSALEEYDPLAPQF